MDTLGKRGVNANATAGRRPPRSSDVTEVMVKKVAGQRRQNPSAYDPDEIARIFGDKNKTQPRAQHIHIDCICMEERQPTWSPEKSSSTKVRNMASSKYQERSMIPTAVQRQTSRNIYNSTGTAVSRPLNESQTSTGNRPSHTRNNQGIISNGTKEVGLLPTKVHKDTFRSAYDAADIEDIFDDVKRKAPKSPRASSPAAERDDSKHEYIREKEPARTTNYSTVSKSAPKRTSNVEKRTFGPSETNVSPTERQPCGNIKYVCYSPDGSSESEKKVSPTEHPPHGHIKYICYTPDGSSECLCVQPNKQVESFYVQEKKEQYAPVNAYRSADLIIEESESHRPASSSESNYDPDNEWISSVAEETKTHVRRYEEEEPMPAKSNKSAQGTTKALIKCRNPDDECTYQRCSPTASNKKPYMEEESMPEKSNYYNNQKDHYVGKKYVLDEAIVPQSDRRNVSHTNPRKSAQGTTKTGQRRSTTASNKKPLPTTNDLICECTSHSSPSSTAVYRTN